MRSRNVGAVALVILLGLVVGTLGLVAADLYAVGVLLLFLGGVGAAVLLGDYLIRYFSAKRHALATAGRTARFQGETVLDGAGPGLPAYSLCLRITGRGAAPGPRVPRGGTW
jgi:hypothetical protein